jgi:hypothetical protein
VTKGWVFGSQNIRALWKQFGVEARLVIPVFRIFWGNKKTFLPGFLRISFFPVFSGGVFHGNFFFERSQDFLFFLALTGIFHRNSCWTGIPVFTLDSSGFLRIPVLS